MRCSSKSNHTVGNKGTTTVGRRMAQRRVRFGSDRKRKNSVLRSPDNTGEEKRSVECFDSF